MPGLRGHLPAAAPLLSPAAPLADLRPAPSAEGPFPFASTLFWLAGWLLALAAFAAVRRLRPPGAPRPGKVEPEDLTARLALLGQEPDPRLVILALDPLLRAHLAQKGGVSLTGLTSADLLRSCRGAGSLGKERLMTAGELLGLCDAVCYGGIVPPARDAERALALAGSLFAGKGGEG